MGKKCTKCDEEKALEDFTHFNCGRSGKIRVHSTCKKCKAKESLAYHYAHRGTCLARLRNAKLKMLYGIDSARFEGLWEKQKGLCAVCKHPLVRGRGTHVDHHHGTGKVRGLLCNGCNVGIGQFKESPEAMIRAVEYLRESA